MFVAHEINHTVSTLMATTSVSHGHSTLIISTTLLVEHCDKAFKRLICRDVIKAGDYTMPRTWCYWI
jgi:hypothetical protein